MRYDPSTKIEFFAIDDETSTVVPFVIFHTNLNEFDESIRINACVLDCVVSLIDSQTFPQKSSYHFQSI